MTINAQNVKINFDNNTIEITKAFSKRASNPMTKEFEELMELQNKLPEFKVVVRTTTRKVKRDYLKGLTYEFMRQYIERHDDENNSNMVEFKKRTVKNDDNVMTDSYGEVRKWFLEVYPEINRAA